MTVSGVRGEDGAKALLEANGYVVLKATSYRKAQERQRIAECVRDGEIDRRKSVEAWAHDLSDELRRMRDRLTFVYGVARAAGVTVEDLAGDQDWTAADISAEVKAFRDMQMRGSRTRTGQSHDDALAEFRRLYPRMASLLDQASPS